MNRWTLILLMLLLAGCHTPPSQFPVAARPVDPMAELCITDNFSAHTDKELAACRRWLLLRGHGPTVPGSSPTLIMPVGGGLYMVVP
jgi:hypothetical protein